MNPKDLSPTLKAEKIVSLLRGVVPQLNPPIHGMFQVQRNDPYRVLVCGILSARSKDEKTVPVCRRLFERYPTPEALLRAPLEELEQVLKGIGLYRQKAKYLKGAVKMMLERYGGRLPDSLEELTRLPGVGRKIANIILIHVFNADTIAVDTHVHRIANRLGLVETKTPEETESALKRLLPKRLWKEINYLLVGLGQTVCSPKGPKCNLCPLRDLCEFYPRGEKGKENS